jgi:hypothetical protein
MASLLLVLLVSGAEVVFDQTTFVQAPQQPPGAGVKSRVYYGERRIRLEAGADGGPALVLRLDDERAFRLDPARKLALEMDVARLRAQAQQDTAMAGELMGARDARPRTTALPKPLSVAGYACDGYRITAGPTTLDVYVTRALPVGMDRFTEFLEWTGAATSLGPIVDALRALSGFPLETRSRVMVLGEPQETRTTVIRVRVGPLAAQLFDVPPGFKVVRESDPAKEDLP